MNRRQIRERVFTLVDWAPRASPDALLKVHELINQAYDALCLEAPFLFFQETLHLATLPDVTPQEGLSVADTLTTTDDPWILRRTLPTSEPNITTWTKDRTWDGRILTFTDPQGRIHRHRVRTYFEEGQQPQVYEYISLMTPWEGAAGVVFTTWRIYTETYFIPDDVMEVKSAYIYGENANVPMQIYGQDEAEAYGYADRPSAIGSGPPYMMYRGDYFQLDPPLEVATLDDPDTDWKGPERAGTFEYVYTYCWGLRDDEFTNPDPDVNMNGVVGGSYGHPGVPRWEPLWESAPSPISTTQSSGQGVRVTTPNIDFIQGFYDQTGAVPGALRHRHSGWQKRIYRRRVTQVAGVLPGEQPQETGETFYLLTERPGYETQWIDTGLITPDYHRRLRAVHGYQSIRFSPRPDRRYEVDIRCIRSPQPLTEDQDVPKMQKGSDELIIYRTLRLWSELQDRPGSVVAAQANYDRVLLAMSNRYGDLRAEAVPVEKSPARATPGRRRGVWKMWYRLPNT